MKRGTVTAPRSGTGGNTASSSPGGGLQYYLAKPRIAPTAFVTPQRVSRLTFGVDATGSREECWAMSLDLTDAILAAVPGQIEVRLAVHGGDRLHTFTGFTTNAKKLRRRVAGIKCKVGPTKMLDILRRSIGRERPDVLIYIGDMFEESEGEAMRMCDGLGHAGTRLIVLHDRTGRFDERSFSIFRAMTARTGGAVIPFDYSAIELVREVCEAAALLAVGGLPMVMAQPRINSGTKLLLTHMAVGDLRDPR